MAQAAFLLPFASGSAPAAKGVITEMCPPHLRQDALSAITLVESAATLSTQGLFGFIYASLSAIGRANLTFFCNGVSLVLSTGVVVMATNDRIGTRDDCGGHPGLGSLSSVQQCTRRAR